MPLMTEKNACGLGVDIGGQSVKLALVDGSGQILLRSQLAIHRDDSPVELIPGLCDQVAGLLSPGGHGVAGVGIVMPGYMDKERTRLLFAANLPGLNGTSFLADLRGQLGKALGLRVVYDADSNAAAYGEYRLGSGQGCRRLIVAAIGTGLGAGVIIDGQVLRVREHIAGSLGHVIVQAGGTKCPCGARGCVEALSAGPAIERLAREAAERDGESRLAELGRQRGRLSCVEVSEAAAAGDQAAEQIIAQAGWWLGAGVASWAAIYAPEKVLFAGGVAGLGAPLLNAARQGMSETGQPRLVSGIELGLATLGADAGMIGAAMLAMDAA